MNKERRLEQDHNRSGPPSIGTSLILSEGAFGLSRLKAPHAIAALAQHGGGIYRFNNTDQVPELPAIWAQASKAKGLQPPVQVVGDFMSVVGSMELGIQHDQQLAADVLYATMAGLSLPAARLALHGIRDARLSRRSFFRGIFAMYFTTFLILRLGLHEELGALGANRGWDISMYPKRLVKPALVNALRLGLATSHLKHARPSAFVNVVLWPGVADRSMVVEARKAAHDPQGHAYYHALKEYSTLVESGFQPNEALLASGALLLEMSRYRVTGTNGNGITTLGVPRYNPNVLGFTPEEGMLESSIIVTAVKMLREQMTR